MAGSLDRSAVEKYANQFWFVPCQDGNVWLSNQPIKVAGEMKKRKLDPATWKAVFLEYDGPFIDGLFFIRDTQVANLSANKFDSTKIPAADKILVQDWWGLNDC